jgi:Porin subfamily
VSDVDRYMKRCLLRRMPLRAIIVVLAMTLSEAVTSGPRAQTLIEPNSRPKSQPPGSAKPQPALRTKTCSAFGAGFVQLPGTDTCVKIGGFVTIDGGVNHGR